MHNADTKDIVKSEMCPLFDEVVEGGCLLIP